MPPALTLAMQLVELVAWSGSAHLGVQRFLLLDDLNDGGRFPRGLPGSQMGSAGRKPLHENRGFYSQNIVRARPEPLCLYDLSTARLDIGGTVAGVDHQPRVFDDPIVVIG